MMRHAAREKIWRRNQRKIRKRGGEGGGGGGGGGGGFGEVFSLLCFGNRKLEEEEESKMERKE
jgi:hypothetical protein